ncbi:MAG: L-lysine 6-transaminase [Candidatus Latescibacteria bacterium]|nr:L-lysine 6-transaminase [Candidatus Latescibacterota bacterium]NIM66483.1 L-lysine 6-transaminase [Candidatus Latescibacterota bacterium]NIO02963.1 L-lysine 6-transaminase [Candidatus Latescibacterota bacterium]NIO30098.1 L-lysine 6-transaminase [Candidatus Latescibacterota bacterium]NIO57717.1 L-lysine 6-transaminase [Candidatus Latescibacterota bacterium]
MREAAHKQSDLRVDPDKVLETLGKHMNVDGFPIVFDPKKSKGSRLVDEATGKTYLDLFMFFATCPIGFNHPRLLEKDFLERLTTSAVNKPSNSDFYSTYMAELVETIERVAMPPELPNIFFIEGGALGVENALKAAFDWKVRKNFERGAKKEIGTQVIHFREAFHGRTGYTLSLTNTNPVKTDYYPKFDWPRITNPKITFPLEDRLDEVIAAEEKAKEEIKAAIRERGDDIAALIIESIQGEGGDNHFRPEFFKFLREITEENEIILVFDEVQTGVGLTGKFWAYEHMGVVPDILAFGKKMQVCGMMASDKINEVESVFKVPGRINSTWGGNFTDMVRATRYLQIIHEENLVENARIVGDYLLSSLGKIAERYPDVVTSTRGRGLMVAFDLPDRDKRQSFVSVARDNGLIAAGCGTRTVRFRPALNLTMADVDEGMEIVDKTLKEILA